MPHADVACNHSGKEIIKLGNFFESPEINPLIQSKLIFNKVPRIHNGGKNKYFQQMVLGNLDICMQKNVNEPLLYICHTQK